MTTTSIDKGSAWSDSILYSGWGGVEADDREVLGDTLVNLFNAKINKIVTGDYKEDIVWLPVVSEVWGDAHGHYPDDIKKILADCRKELTVYVYDHMDEILDKD